MDILNRKYFIGDYNYYLTLYIARRQIRVIRKSVPFAIQEQP